MSKARIRDYILSPNLDREFNYEQVDDGQIDFGVITRLGPDGILTT